MFCSFSKFAKHAQLQYLAVWPQINYLTYQFGTGIRFELNKMQEKHLAKCLEYSKYWGDDEYYYF